MSPDATEVRPSPVTPSRVIADVSSRRARLLLIGFLFAAALGIRLYHLNQPPFNFHATRQYRSLLIARSYYYDSQASLPEWKKSIATISRERQGILEPPIMERLVAAGYRLTGGEHLWIPQLLSSVFWLIGGGFLYLIAAKVGGPTAALFATGFYLFLPFAVVASRSFQPDPMMVMFLLASVVAILRFHDRPTRVRLALAVALSGITIFIKPVSLFTVLALFVAVGIWRVGIRRTIRSPAFLLFAATVLLPTIAFYVYGVFIAGVLREQARASFLPQLLLDGFFWRGWIGNIGQVIGFLPFIGALAGIFLVETGLPRSLLVGLWTGYAAFCLVFDYHIATHDYYHLQLVPIVALSLGPVGALVASRLTERRNSRFDRTAMWAIAVLALVLSASLSRARMANPGYESKVRIAWEIGERVKHSTNAVYLSGDYGLPLEYHGELSGRPWPLASDLEWERLAGVPVREAGQRFEAEFAKDAPQYFIVEDLHELELQPDLKAFLTDRFPILAQTSEYLIFRLGGGRDRRSRFRTRTCKFPPRDMRWVTARASRSCVGWTAKCST